MRRANWPVGIDPNIATNTVRVITLAEREEYLDTLAGRNLLVVEMYGNGPFTITHLTEPLEEDSE